MDELGLSPSFSNSSFTSLIDCKESQEKTSNNTDSGGSTNTRITAITMATIFIVPTMKTAQ